jgi:8-oxo-dGTP pyrophosphatase MutT (NUDIX family)
MDYNDERYFIYRNISDYEPFDENELKYKKEILKFLESSNTPFENTNLPGHITGSALVVDKSFTYTLLTHHPIIDKWLQFGGHSDGNSNTILVAMKEAFEESGLKSLSFFYPYSGVFSLDVHPIGANHRLTNHTHFDVRILLVADMNEEYHISYESKALEWVKIEDGHKYNSQEAFLRLLKKASSLRI